ncbi:MAG: type II CAAX endopeptidase family protein [bacterium]|nr:type II CAAX endopeptidase family protein [bacterium]
MPDNETKIKTLICIAIAIFLDICYLTDIWGLIKMEPSLLSKWVAELQQWILLGLVFGAVLLIEKKPFLLWPETKRKWHFYPAWIIAIFAGAVIVGIAVPIVFKLLKLPIEQGKLESLINYYCECRMLMVFASITAGVVEELLFRGFLMPRLEILLKKGWIVVLASTILFGLAHTSSFSLIGFVVPIFIGLIFSYHYYKFRNIRVLILVHLLIDFASFITSCP